MHFDRRERMRQWTVLVAVVCVTVLELAALRAGVDGVMFGTVMALIGVLVGSKVKRVIW